MSDVTEILARIEEGDPHASNQLLPLVYEELRKLAAHKMAQEAPGQTLQATALVHEAYIRLVDNQKADHWRSQAHFFGAAAEAMRRILVDAARRKNRPKHGGDCCRIQLDQAAPDELASPDDLLAIDEALDRLAMTDKSAAELVKLRYFAGYTIQEAAEILGVSPRSANYMWAYARAWILQEIDPD